MPVTQTTQLTTYVASNGQIAAKEPDRSFSQGGSPPNGSTVRYGSGSGGPVTVFDNQGGAGTVIDSRGNIRSGTFTFNSRGESVFEPALNARTLSQYRARGY